MSLWLCPKSFRGDRIQETGSVCGLLREAPGAQTSRIQQEPPGDKRGLGGEGFSGWAVVQETPVQTRLAKASESPVIGSEVLCYPAGGEQGEQSPAGSSSLDAPSGYLQSRNQEEN